MITIVTVAGMRSEHCRRAIFTALTPVEGIRCADVTLGRVVIDHDGSVSEDAVRAAIAVTGYVVVDVTNERRVLPIADSTVHESRI